MWLGLLFTMIGLITQFQQSTDDETGSIDQPFQSTKSPQGLVRIYGEKVVQCLVLGKYIKSVPYTIETLLLYFMIGTFPMRRHSNWELDPPGNHRAYCNAYGISPRCLPLPSDLAVSRRNATKFMRHH